MYLTLQNTPAHILLGIPSQLPADYNWDFFAPLSGLVLPERVDDLLHFQGTLESDGYNLLQNYAGFEGSTANTLSYLITSSPDEPIQVPTHAVQCLAPTHPLA